MPVPTPSSSASLESEATEFVPFDPRAGAVSWLAVLVVFAATLALYLATASHRWDSDSIGLFVFHDEGRGSEYQHVLYLLAGDVAAALLPFLSSEWQLRVLSAAATAGTAALVVVLAQRLGAGTFAALGGAALFAFSYAAWIAGTWIEVHALHAFALALTAVCVHAAAVRGVLPAVVVGAVGLALVFGTHRSGVVFGPGVVLWIGASLALQGRPLSIWKLLLGVGPALLAVLLLAMGLANLYRFGELSLGTDETTRYLDKWQSHGTPWRSLVDEWVLPSAVLLPIALVGVVRGTAGWVRAGLAGFVLPSLAFFLWYGIPEHGGFALASLFVCAVFAALGIERAPMPKLSVAGLVLVQLLAGGGNAFEWRSEMRFDERLEQAQRALPNGGRLLAITRPRNTTPLVNTFLEDTVELRLQGLIMTAVGNLGPDAAGLVVAQYVDAAHAEGSAAALDLSFVRPPASGPNAEQAAVAKAIVEHLEGRYAVGRVDHDDWPMLVLDPR